MIGLEIFPIFPSPLDLSDYIQRIRKKDVNNSMSNDSINTNLPLKNIRDELKRKVNQILKNHGHTVNIGLKG